MTLADLIESDADDVFLNADEFAELVTFYPYGEALSAFTVLAVVVPDELEGTRESYGDGVTLERDAGTRIRESWKLEVAADVNVDATRRPSDLVKLADGTFLMVKRILGIDQGMKTVLATRSDTVTTRRQVSSG